MSTSFHMLASLSLLYLLFSLQPPSSTAQTTPQTCKTQTFNKTTTFANCIDLPTLHAVLHWTYHSDQSSLSMAYSARPTAAHGWVAWAINPKALAMVGSQALIAFRPNASSPIYANTYDIKSFHNIVKGPISYQVANLSAEETDGVITIFATWALPQGMTEINQVWQVGPVVNGRIGRHEFKPANLNSKMKLNLVNGPTPGPSPPPTVTPAPVTGGDVAGATPSGGPHNGAVNNFGISAMLLAFGALILSYYYNI